MVTLVCVGPGIARVETSVTVAAAVVVVVKGASTVVVTTVSNGTTVDSV